MKTLAVTGARGRLAPPLAHYLRSRGHEVHLFSRCAEGDLRGLAELQSPEILAAFDAVLHLGWSSVPLLSEQSPGIEEREDFPLARQIVAAAQRAAKPPLLVFFSTAAVYGNTLGDAAHEEAECCPTGRYAAAKLEAERIFARAPRTCTLRVTNVFSMGCRSHRSQGIIPIMLESCLGGAPLTIWGDGSATKDYLAASDLHAAVEGVVAASCEGVFNVASGHTLSLNDLVALVQRATGREIPIVRAPHYAWDVERTRVSAEKLHRATGWGARVDPENAIAAMAAALLE